MRFVLAIVAFSVWLAGAQVEDLPITSDSTALATCAPLPAADVPAIITTHATADLRQDGFTNLGEVLEITPGFFAEFGAGDISMRARGFGDPLNRKHLVMIDGIPVNNSWNFRAPMRDELSLFWARRVDILRGASGFYNGREAYLDAINIVPGSLTRDGYHLEGRVSAGLQSGTPDDIRRRQREVLLHQNTEGDFVIPKRIGINGIARFGVHELQATYGYSGTPAGLEMGRELSGAGDWMARGPYRDDEQSHFARVSYRATEGQPQGFGTGMIVYGRRDGYGQGRNGQSHPDNRHEVLSYIPYVKFDRRFADKLQLTAFARMNYSTERARQNDTLVSGRAFSIERPGQDFQMSIKAEWDIAPFLGIVGGYDYSVNRPDSGIAQAGGEESWVVAKLQPLDDERYAVLAGLRSTLPLLQGLHLRAGVRFTHATTNGERASQWTPHGSMVFKILPPLQLKVLYDMGTHFPGYDQIAFNADQLADARLTSPSQIVTPPALKPELVHAVQAQVCFSNPRLDVRLAWYRQMGVRSFVRDFLVTDTESVDLWFNTEDLCFARGGELEIALRPIRALTVWTNLAYGENWWIPVKGDYIRVFDRVPIVKLNSGIRYTAPFGFRASFVNRWITSFSRFAPRIDAAPATSDALGQYYRGYALLDCNLRQEVLHRFGVELSVRNLFNTQYLFDREVVPMPNRTIMLTVTGEFTMQRPQASVQP
jgi:outer membrane receptor protein involved in Fe transport